MAKQTDTVVRTLCEGIDTGHRDKTWVAALASHFRPRSGRSARGWCGSRRPGAGAACRATGGRPLAHARRRPRHARGHAALEGLAAGYSERPIAPAWASGPARATTAGEAGHRPSSPTGTRPARASLGPVAAPATAMAALSGSPRW